jgi:hypothetical protein
VPSQQKRVFAQVKGKAVNLKGMGLPDVFMAFTPTKSKDSGIVSDKGDTL